MQLQELVQYLDSFLNIFKFNDFCPNGLQIEGKESIKKIGLSVSADLFSIEKAIEEGVDALIVHHGLFWSRDSYPLVGSKRKKIALLLEHDISLLAYHLPLDAHREVGNNWKAAKDLKWQELQAFGESEEKAIGVKGIFEEISVKSFIANLESYYGHQAFKALGGKTSIKSAALISGGAYKEIIRAAKESVDCFITGNFDEPVWAIAHEEKINFFALGHSATERIGPQALMQHLATQFNIPTIFIDTYNPF